MSANENETIADIVVEKRDRANEIERDAAEKIAIGKMISDQYAREVIAELRKEADRLEAAWKREAESIERIVRDAIIDYQEMYPHAPSDDAERDLIDRAKRGNSWLTAHGYETEKTIWDKEETPCL